MGREEGEEKRGREERKGRECMNEREGGREGRHWSRERGEKGDRIGTKGRKGGWGKGCVHRVGSIDAPVRCHSKHIQQFLGQNQSNSRQAVKNYLPTTLWKSEISF
jgi:hypothetical protein